jgi:cardiolipin synthase
MAWWHALAIQLAALGGALLTVFTITWVLMTKKDATSAVAWCLLVFFLPFLGSLFFLFFGYQHVHRPLKRKRKHHHHYRAVHPGAAAPLAPKPAVGRPGDANWEGVALLAQRFGAQSRTHGNWLELYHEGAPAFEAMFAAIAAARHHIHMEFFIVQPDDLGRRMIGLLAEKARQGVEVRLVYDAMGSRRLHQQHLGILEDAGGRASVFLPLNPFRRRIQINMRNHRKNLVVDGNVAFTGGLNIGDEYLGKVARYGFWRDTHMQIRGPAVAGLQRVFVEDWDFAAGEYLEGDQYFPAADQPGNVPMQVIQSGPDQEQNTIREIYFAAIIRARKRLWIASPYFVPDTGLLDALCLAGYCGVDVRLLTQHHPDKWIPYFAARYYLNDVMAAGIKVYQYTKGMLHSKVVLVDGEWASVGSANLDNRSLHLNFELNCLFYEPRVVQELEKTYLNDLEVAIQLDKSAFAHRPLSTRMVENACRLLSPVL